MSGQRYHCVLCGEWWGTAHMCATGPVVTGGSIPPIPPGWKPCPHCLGSGVVQADDQRYSESPLGKEQQKKGVSE